VISPKLTQVLAKLAAKRKLTHVNRRFKAGMLEGFFLVISASSSKAVNTLVSKEGKSVGAIVNVADSPELCDFIVPSLVERGELKIAVSTSAKCPGLAKELRLELEKNYGPEYGEYVEILGLIRNKLLKDKRKYDKKKRLLSELFVSGIPELLRSGSISELDKLLIAILGRGYSLASLGSGIKE
jgi:precorrin-2 dehydrogenase/sirohydrochlorin ferrochelatase